MSVVSWIHFGSQYDNHIIERNTTFNNNNNNYNNTTNNNGSSNLYKTIFQYFSLNYLMIKSNNLGYNGESIKKV